MTSFIIEQKITAFANQYRVFSVTDGRKDSLLAFAHQKRLAFKEKVDFFSSEARDKLLFSVKAEKAMDIHGKFNVTDDDGAVIGSVRKAFRSSLLRSTWEILDKNDELVVVVRERSQALAIFRRLWQFIPYISDIPFLLKYHFDFVTPNTDTVVARYSKTTLIRDHYLLEIEDEQLVEKVGWQTLVTQAVLLDALQGR